MQLYFIVGNFSNCNLVCFFKVVDLVFIKVSNHSSKLFESQIKWHCNLLFVLFVHIVTFLHWWISCENIVSAFSKNDLRMFVFLLAMIVAHILSKYCIADCFFQFNEMIRWFGKKSSMLSHMCVASFQVNLYFVGLRFRDIRNGKRKCLKKIHVSLYFIL